MLDHPGSVGYLRKMAERCRSAARELGGDEARELLELAQRCEERLSERARAGELAESRYD